VNPWSKAFLIALRIFVGWHFLYEGVYKVESDTGSTVYSTSRYAIQGATAKLRTFFEGTPPGGLSRDAAFARADAWHDEIVRNFAAQKALGEDQKARLAALRDQVKLSAIAAARGEIDPRDVVNFDWTYVHAETLRIPPPPQVERFSSLGYLQSSAGPLRGFFRSMVPDMDGLARLTVAEAQAMIDRRHGEILNHYASAGTPFTVEQQARLAAVRDSIKVSVAEMLNSPAFQARLADYKQLRQRVSTDPGSLHAPFTKERLDADRKNLDLIAAEMLEMVNEPINELAVQTQAIATVAQLGAGPLPRPKDTALWVDTAIKLSLIAIGVCLMLGVFTPLAALAAAGQLAMFYFASPPFPGYPAASVGGHYLYVDRNLIEMAAAFVIATTGSGNWAGLDAYLLPVLQRWFRRPAAMTALEEEPQPVAATATVSLNS